MVRLSTLAAPFGLGLAVVLVLVLGRHSSFATTGTPASAFQILAGYSAKEACSCVFDVQQTDDYCTNFGMQEGVTDMITIDHTANTVTAQAGSSTRVARFGSATTGCTLDPL
jgi:hypothetical protein